MNVNIFLVDRRGNRRQLNINLSDKIGNKKKELNQSNAIWKCHGEVLRDDKTYENYGIEENEIILTNI